MWTMLFMILMIWVFVKTLWLAVRMSWGIMKILVNLVLLPMVLLGLMFSGLMILALPILIVVGLVMLVVGN